MAKDPNDASEQQKRAPDRRSVEPLFCIQYTLSEAVRRKRLYHVRDERKILVGST